MQGEGRICSNETVILGDQSGGWLYVRLMTRGWLLLIEGRPRQSEPAKVHTPFVMRLTAFMSTVRMKLIRYVLTAFCWKNKDIYTFVTVPKRTATYISLWTCCAINKKKMSADTSFLLNPPHQISIRIWTLQRYLQCIQYYSAERQVLANCKLVKIWK